MFKIKCDNIYYYFGNIDTYREALISPNSSSSNSHSHSDSLRITQLADAIINVQNNTIIKSRYMLDEIFDEYYTCNNPMHIKE